MAEVSIISQIETLVAQYRTSKRKPAIVMEGRKSALNLRLAVLGDAKTKLNALFTAAKDLALTGTSSRFLSYTVASSKSDIATATASSAASLGSHTLLVTQLAKADAVQSNTLTGTDTGIVTAEGAGVKTFSITVNGVATDISVTLDAGETNSSILSKIITATNASGAGVTAALVSPTGTTSRVVFTSKETGSGNAVTLTNGQGTLLDQLGLTPGVISGRTSATGSNAGYTHSSTSALDANFVLDGISIVRQSNTVKDALGGVTLELKGVQDPSAQPLSLTVAYNKEGIRASVDSFLKAYNDALSYITAKTAVNPELKTREVLAGDVTFQNLRISLRTIAGGRVASVASGNPSVLAEIGITASATGALSISNVKVFEDAMASDVTKIADLFNSDNGVAVRLKSALDGFVSTGGEIDTTRNAVRDQVTGLSNRIKRFDELLNRRVSQFRGEFLRLQSLIDQASRQMQTIQSLTIGRGLF
jgi:flagellar hook-associated protein 2